MKKALVIGGLAVVLCLVLAPYSQAFDGQRQGFILGGGLGVGLTTYTYSASGASSDRFNEVGFMTDFKIGYAPNEQVEIYYSNKLSWFDEGGAVLAHGVGSAAVNYYLQPQMPWYISGGVGLGSVTAPFEENSEYWVGFGFFGGVGYEFSRHFAVEFDMMLGFPGESGITFNGINPRVVIVGTAF